MVLSRIYDEMTSGNLSAEEKAQAERILWARARTIDPKAFVNASSEAMVLPFSGLGVTNMSSASIDTKLLPNGKIRLKSYMKQQHWAKSKRLPKNLLLGLDSIEVDPDTVIGLYLYDEGGQIMYVPALYLLQLGNQENTKIGTMAGEAAFTGLTLGFGGEAVAAGEGMEAAGTSAKAIWLARGATALRVADATVTVLSVASRVINDNRGLILEKFPEDGEAFLKHWQTVDTVVSRSTESDVEVP